MGMRVELLVVPDCVNEDGALRLLRSSLDEVGLGKVSVNVVVIDSQSAAERHRFVGSPTILIDGVDPFAVTDAVPALACRMYPGGQGVPDGRELRHALKRAAAANHG